MLVETAGLRGRTPVAGRPEVQLPGSPASLAASSHNTGEDFFQEAPSTGGKQTHQTVNNLPRLAPCTCWAPRPVSSDVPLSCIQGGRKQAATGWPAFQG